MKRIISAFIIVTMMLAYSVNVSANVIMQTGISSADVLEISDSLYLELPENYTYHGGSGLICSADYREQLVISAQETDFDDFDLLSDKELDTVASSFVSLGNARGVNGFATTSFGGHKFIKLTYNDTASYKFEYITIYDGIKLTLKWLADSTKISESDIMGDIGFRQLPATPSTSSFTYEEPESGISFKVPENWVMEVVTDENENEGYLHTVMLHPAGRTTVSIEYSRRNMYKLARTDQTPQEYTNSLNTKAQIIRIIGYEGSDISRESLGGTIYGTVTQTGTLTNPSADLDAATEKLYKISFSEGFVHVFKLTAIVGNNYHSTFNSLVTSVNYPGEVSTLSDIKKVEKESPTPSGDDAIIDTVSKDSGVNPAVLIAIIFAVVAIFVAMIVAVIIRSGRKSAQQVPTEEEIAASMRVTKKKKNIFNVDANMQNNPNIIFCRNCSGSVNIVLHTHCPHCGAEIPESKAREMQATAAGNQNSNPQENAQSNDVVDIPKGNTEVTPEE